MKTNRKTNVIKTRYSATPIIDFNGKQVYGLYKEPQWISNVRREDLLDFVVSSDLEGRADLISKKLYNNPNYYWVLIVVNKPMDPLNWPKTGQVIKFVQKHIVMTNI